MRNLLLILMVGILLMPVNAQNLIEKYKKGTVKLVPDNSYAQENNWDKIFEGYNEKHFGHKGTLKFLSDSSLVVSYSHQRYYSRFSSKGKFQNNFRIITSEGASLTNNRPIAGTIDNNLFTTANASGRIRFLDSKGNLKNSLELNLKYLVHQVIALPNGKIAVAGWTQWPGKNRDFVAIIDTKTKKEKIIWDYFVETKTELKSEPFNYVYYFKKGGIITLPTMPFVKSTGFLTVPPQIASVGNTLVVTMPVNGEIFIYDLNGKLRSKTKVTWPNQQLSVDEQKEIQKKAIAKYKKADAKIASWVSKEENEKAKKQWLKEMETDLANISKPIPKPYFAHIIKDSDDNLLFFEYPKEKNANKFNVWIYKNGGQFVCQSSFVCDEYELEINPAKMVFHQGNIYAIQKLKNAKGNPVRLVRFKLD